MTDLDKLEALAKAAPQGEWKIHTSNSWRRVMARDKGNTVRVIEPTNHPKDKWPDLIFGNGVEAYLEAMQPATVLALIAELRAARDRASDAPQRAIVFHLDVQADSMRELSDVLFNLSNRVAADDLSTHSVSGGYGSGFEHWLTVADGPTHDEYLAQLDDYLKRKEAARAEANAGGES
ncbi:hypothetical protein [Paraburkholderia bannensis]|uniref:hypothetical protein n=1 Tax=Paraburkholderia bannensis TaxID=765414 RepID=UPI0004858E78|nr:hypothetical protein [Paraburkholderia bannensis]